MLFYTGGYGKYIGVKNNVFWREAKNRDRFTGAPAHLRATGKIAWSVRVRPSRVRVSPLASTNENEAMVSER